MVASLSLVLHFWELQMEALGLLMAQYELY
jgi:hypothetical protein